ncbi:MAG: DUF2062 domain-containing protein [Sandaracinaceae bacterium]|nr:DUF2062 domain-containing protein [Sandaracinaceae bacterium]
MKLWTRLKNVVVSGILGLDDSPQRIALGVFLGFVVAMTPTLGLQIVIYVALAALLRVNKVAGVPILFITNPVTAVPVYGFCWWLGNLVLHGGKGESSWEEVQARLMAAESGNNESLWGQLLSADFWSRVGSAMAQLGGRAVARLAGQRRGARAPSLRPGAVGVGAYRKRTRESVNPEPALPEAIVRNERSTPPPPPPR